MPSCAELPRSKVLQFSLCHGHIPFLGALPSVPCPESLLHLRREKAEVSAVRTCYEFDSFFCGPAVEYSRQAFIRRIGNEPPIRQ